MGRYSGSRFNEVHLIGKLRQECIKGLRMRAYSTDLRQKIIDAYNSEGSFRNIAKRFSVSRSFVQKLVGRYRDTGLVSALPHGGGQKPKLKSLEIEVLRQIVIDNNDATLEELCELLSAKAKIKISRSTMDSLLQKLQLTCKKKRFMQMNRTATE